MYNKHIIKSTASAFNSFAQCEQANNITYSSCSSRSAIIFSSLCSFSSSWQTLSCRALSLYRADLEKKPTQYGWWPLVINEVNFDIFKIAVFLLLNSNLFYKEMKGINVRIVSSYWGKLRKDWMPFFDLADTLRIYWLLL